MARRRRHRRSPRLRSRQVVEGSVSPRALAEAFAALARAGERRVVLDDLPEAWAALRPMLIASTKTMLAEPGTLGTVRSLVHPAREVILADDAAILGLWALVCGLVDSLGDGDANLLRQLVPDA